MDYEELAKGEGVIKSKIRFEKPEPDVVEKANMASELLAAFKRHSKRTLLVDLETRTEWTGSRLLDEVGRVACGLQKRLKLKPNDVVLSICDHSGAETVFALGVLLAGGALYGSAASDGYEEWRTLSKLVPPDFIVTNARLHQQALELRRNLPETNPTIVWIDNPFKSDGTTESQPDNQDETTANNNNNNNAQSSEYYAEMMERDQVLLLDDLLTESLDMDLLQDIANSRIKPKEHVCTYMLTSGSTGRPKVVPSTHEEILNGIYSMQSTMKNPPTGDGEIISESDLKDVVLMPDIDENSVLAGDLPLDHGAGINIMFLSFITGSKYITMPSYSEEHYWKSVQDYKITASYASTTFAYRLLLNLKQLIDTKQTMRWNIDSLKDITCAGSKLSFIDLIREIQQHYKHLTVRQCYGATEVGFMAILNRKSTRTHLESVGYLMPGMLAKVVQVPSGGGKGEGEDQIHCGPNEPGEFLVWTKTKFKSYKCEESKDVTGKLLYDQCHDSQGFYRTGDEVHYDEEGRFYVHGRFKDTLFLDTDWKILPAELEAIVDEHPLVQYSAIVGLPNPDLPGCHKPRAFVKLIDSQSKEFEELKDEDLRNRLLANDREFISDNIYQFVADRTAEPKHLKGGVKILDEFPRNGLLQKIDRQALKLIE